MMTENRNIEHIITDHAKRIADSSNTIVKGSRSEEDIRHAFNKLIDDFVKEAGLEIKARHEHTIEGGRIDSKYSRVIIEYKNPHGRQKLTTSTPASKQKVTDQVKERFQSLARGEGLDPNKLFGVGIDGRHVIFIRYIGDAFHIDPPTNITEMSVERLLRALTSLGARGKSFQPEELAQDFGAKSNIAKHAIKALFTALIGSESKKVETFRRQWTLLYEEISGYDLSKLDDSFEELLKSYDLTGAERPAEAMFALHTYYAMFIKLLAVEIVAAFNPFATSFTKKCAGVGTAEKLKGHLEELEDGGIWRTMGIRNFLEGDLFAWYLEEWDEGVHDAIREVIRALDSYDPTTLSVDPDESRDLLKDLYQDLLPRVLRHDLGEYYTPDWLAEHVLNEVGYSGNPESRILDPAVGSGTFLVAAINRIRNWFAINRHECGFGTSELGRKILNGVVGFDLNPVAVMAARTNYLLAIRELLPHLGEVEIPVYLCDSIMIPEEYDELFTGPAIGQSRTVSTVIGDLPIPNEVSSSRDELSRYTEILEESIEGGYTPDEFLERLTTEGLRTKLEIAHRSLFESLEEADANDQNGIWARIIKNAFAPIFTDEVDYVVGNPPWVFWNNLPGRYREDVKELMNEYGLRTKGKDTMRRLGAAGKDLSMLFVYVAASRYLKDGGRLGYVITQTLFQTGAGDEFRRFKLPDGTPLGVRKVEDWVAVEPFRESAKNKTATLIIEKNEKTMYPVSYSVYKPVKEFRRKTSQLNEVMGSVDKFDMHAWPSRHDQPNSFWTIMVPGATPHQEKGLPNSERYRARKGVDTNLVSAYRLEILRENPDGTLIVSNITKGSKKPVAEITKAVEKQFIYPSVAGSSLGQRWGYDVHSYMFVPHDEKTAMKPVATILLKTKYPKSFAYINTYKEDLESRPLHKRWGKSHPFFSVYNIGAYTFAPFKVAWKASTKTFGVSVLSSIEDEYLGEKLVMPQKSVIIIPFGEGREAYFVAGLLNSSVARYRVNNSITTWVHKDILNVLPAIPDYNREDDAHLRMSELSEAITETQDNAEIPPMEREIDELAKEVWSIAEIELERAREALGGAE